MKEYLLDTFRYNDWANKQLLDAISALPERGEVIKLFSHLITAQDKWFNRVGKEKEDSAFAWSAPVFLEIELAEQWKKSVDKWIHFLENHTEHELNQAISFIRASDGRTMSVAIKDVMLQLNYHSIHHRAQINSLLSQQGIKPPVTDYIFTVLKEIE